MKKARKVIKPSAGLGTRIVDKPTIQFIVEEAVTSGVEDIIIVTDKGKRNFHNYITPADKFIWNDFGTSYNTNLSKVLISKFIIAWKKRYRNLPGSAAAHAVSFGYQASTLEVVSSLALFENRLILNSRNNKRTKL